MSNPEHRSPESLKRRKIYKRKKIYEKRLNPEFKEKERKQRVIKMSTPEERARRAAYKKSAKGKAAEARYRRGERGQFNYWKGHLKHRYGLNHEDIEKMLLSQDGRCALCKDLFTEERSHVIDHDHNSGIVRGLVHRKCNILLGLADDNIQMLELAKKYLMK